MATVSVATTVMVPIDPTGNPVDKKTASIATMTKTSSEIRVDVTGYPTITAYLTTQYAAGWKLIHMDQTYIIMEK